MDGAIIFHGELALAHLQGDALVIHGDVGLAATTAAADRQLVLLAYGGVLLRADLGCLVDAHDGDHHGPHVQVVRRANVDHLEGANVLQMADADGLGLELADLDRPVLADLVFLVLAYGLAAVVSDGGRALAAVGGAPRNY